MRALVFAILLNLVAARSATADAPTVTVLDAGKGPQKQLRFTARKGLKKTCVIRLTMGMSMDLGNGSPVTQGMPTIEMTFDIKVTDVTADGDIAYDLVFKRPRVIATPGVSKAVVSAMSGVVKAFEGITGHSTMSNRGIVKDLELEIPDAVSPQVRQMMDSMKQSFSQLSAPMPEEAVGVGAKWETKTKLAMNGPVIDQTATTTIVALAGNKATLDVKLVQTGKPQKFTANGITADLVSYGATGGGKSVLDVGALLPTKAEMGMKSNMKLTAGGQNVGMAFTFDMTLTSK
jgi:hypothetical protein